MCVIFLAVKTRPTEEMVTRAWDHNKDGAGIAWREGGEVVYEKGIMNIERIKELCAETKLPFVAHFRVASVGGVRPSLTHPFLVGPDASLDLKGRTKNAVLFHNGHWNSWNDRALDAAIHSNNRVPEGSDWSDSRAMAWMVHIYGPGFMELLTGQKGVLMTPKKFSIFTGNGWEQINGVWCSNDYFWKGGRHHNSGPGYYRRLCSVGKCTNHVTGGRDVCDKCEGERKERAEAASKEANGNSEPSPVSIVTGETSRPLAKAFTMPEVEAYYRAKVISKSMMKKYKKAYGLSQERGNRALRGAKTMTALSLEIAERLLTGSPS